jgi:hypothetical protein
MGRANLLASVQNPKGPSEQDRLHAQAGPASHDGVRLPRERLATLFDVTRPGTGDYRGVKPLPSRCRASGPDPVPLRGARLQVAIQSFLKAVGEKPMANPRGFTVSEFQGEIQYRLYLGPFADSFSFETVDAGVRITSAGDARPWNSTPTMVNPRGRLVGQSY